MVLTTAVVAILYIIPLLIKRDKTQSDLLLCAFLFSQGAIAVNVVMLYNETLGPQTVAALYPFHKVPLLALYGIQGFLLLWYSRAMIGETGHFLSKGSLYCLIFVLVIICISVYRTAQVNTSHQSFISAFGLILPLSIALGVRALIRLKRYDNQIRQRFSSIESIRLSWLWYCALGFVCVWGLVLSCHLIANIGSVTNTPWLIHLSKMFGTFNNLPPMLLMSIMVVYGQTIHTLPQDKSVENKEHQEKAFVATLQQKAKLDDLMLRVKIYQDPELRLDGLADSMDMSPRSVSSLLNGHYQKNFYDFVNHYRVCDAQEQLHNQNLKHKTIQRVFEDAGFNSKTTFNTLFKKHTGYTPSEYRKTNTTTQAKHLATSVSEND